MAYIQKLNVHSIYCQFDRKDIPSFLLHVFLHISLQLLHSDEVIKREMVVYRKIKGGRECHAYITCGNPRDTITY